MQIETSKKIARTRNPVAWLGFFLAIAIGANAVAEDFEGELTMKVKDQGTEEEIEFAVKGPKMRVDVEQHGQQMTMLMDAEARTMAMVMPAQRAYMVMNFPDGAIPGQDPAEDFEWEATGETEEILGYSTEKYIAREGNTESEIWATKELGALRALFIDEPGRDAGASPLEEAIRDNKLFPLRIVERGPGGRETSRMDVTQLEKKSLDDSLFEPPPGYQRMQMPAP